jgi:hypothetical protein
VLKLDWAEPGDPPAADYLSVRAKPLAKPISYAPLTREVELELVRRWHENGDERALDWLVAAHRPMVVRMAKNRIRTNGISLQALVEYGMLGLRIAADPPRPSQTKRGKIVGFDPFKGRFSTYARYYADKEMRAALTGDPSPALKEAFEHKVTAELETWGEASEEEWERDDVDYPLCTGGLKILYRDLQQRRPYKKPEQSWTLWNPPRGIERKVRRNYLKHPIINAELKNEFSYYTKHSVLLTTYSELPSNKEGWSGDGHADQDSSFAPAASKGSAYYLPLAVLRERWLRGCNRTGLITFKTNGGLGLFDKFGNRLPVYSLRATLPRKRVSGPVLCLRPVASIYLIGGKISGTEGEVVSFRRTSQRRPPPFASRAPSSPHAKTKQHDPSRET